MTRTHRVEALARLVQMDPDRWSGYTIPFVCMLGADEREEMEQFYVVNSTAKSVRTDLALDLLKQRAESDVDVMKSLIERGETWKVKAQTLVEELNATPIWRNRIRLPGEPKGDSTITSSGMAASVKQLLGTPYFGSITTGNQVKILDAYWQGLREAIPKAFDEPAHYVLQKATGVMVMHGLLISLIEYSIATERSRSSIRPDDPVRVIQDTDERKRRARQRGDEKRVLSRDPMWMLNDEGVRWYDGNRDQIQQYIDSVAKLGERRGRGSIHVSAKRISEAVMDRVHRRPSFAKFTRNPDAPYDEKDLPILDFFAVFNVDAHTPENLFQTARTRTFEAVEGGSVEEKYAKELSRLYAHRYRTYYDELLAKGE